MFKIFTKEVTFPVPGYIVLNINNFNNWFNHPNNNAVYANPGIFLRLDKLSETHVLDYMEKCYGINPNLDLDLLYGKKDVVYSFMAEIKEEWKRLIKKRESEF